MPKGHDDIEEVGDRVLFCEFANKLAQDGSLLRKIREKLGLSKTAFAKQAKISVKKLNGYEQPGAIAGNFWLFCRDLRKTSIDRRFWDDPDYLDKFLTPDPGSKFRGGTRKVRDNWFDWSGDEYDPFRNWIHREKLKELPEEEQGKQLTKPRIKKWFDEWTQLSPRKRASYEISKPLE